MKILSIDPSGTGTTGLFFISKEKTEFIEFKNNDWKKHYFFIKTLIKEKKPKIIIYEDTNYINKRTSDSLNLFRLLGAIENLSVKKIRTINVIKVKILTKKLFLGKIKIKNLEYLPGRGKGWMFEKKRVSIHQLEAYLVYWLFAKETEDNKNKRII